MYIFIRQDLSHTYQIIQAAHATHQAGIRFGKTELPTHFALIGANDENDLQKIAMHLDYHQIEYEMFHEPDHNTGFTAIATRPLYGDQRKPLRKFNTYKGKDTAADALQHFVAAQKPLPPDFQKVINENYWSLLDGEEKC